MCRSSDLHTCYRCKNEVIEGLAGVLCCRQSEERVEGLSAHLIALLALDLLGVGTEKLFLDEE